MNLPAPPKRSSVSEFIITIVDPWMRFNSINNFFFIPYFAVIAGLYILKNAWLAMILYHLGIITILFARKQTLVYNNLMIYNKKTTLGVLLLFSLGGLVLYILWPSVSLNINPAYRFREFGLAGYSLILFMLYFSTVNPILEEHFWRFGGTRGILNDILFAGYHTLVLVYFIKPVYVGSAFLVLVIASGFWTILAQKYQKYLFVILSHAIADLSISLTMILLALKKL